MTDREQIVGETGLGSSQSQPGYDASAGASVGSEPSAAFKTADLVDELSFVIAERRADIAKIKRERNEPDHCKAIRIEFAEKMIARTKAARARVEAYPELLADGAFLLDRLDDFDRELEGGESSRQFYGHVAPAIARFRAAISKALGPSAQDISGEGR